MGFEIDFDEIRKMGLYDYISNHYWEMSTGQLASVLKELDYAIYRFDKEWERVMVETMIEALKDEEE